jgi:hypothetical protein
MAAPQAMTVPTPDWLTRRGAALRRVHDGRTWLVLINGGPEYKLTPLPAGGRSSCSIVQAVNSKRLDKPATYPTAEEAVQGGLEQLRQILGW